MAISVQAFTMLYLRDLTLPQTPEDLAALRADPSLPQHFTGLNAFNSLIGAALVAIPLGKISDRQGRKPFIIFSCAMMSVCYMYLAFGPTLSVVRALAFFFGTANGAFLAVDFALAVDTLPNKADQAKDLGLWGISAFIGSTLGPLVAGPLVQIFGRYVGTPPPSTEGDSYSAAGYFAVMTNGAFWCAMCVILLPKIVGVR